MISGKKQGWACSGWTAGLNSRWLPGTVNKIIPDTLGKSIWSSAVALVPGTDGFLYRTGDTNKLLDLELFRLRAQRSLIQSCCGCVGATIVWDHCEGHLLGVGREWDMAGQALPGLKASLNYGFREEWGNLDSWHLPRLITVQRVMNRISVIQAFRALLLCSLGWEPGVKLPKGWMSCWSTCDIPDADVGVGAEWVSCIPRAQMCA